MAEHTTDQPYADLDELDAMWGILTAAMPDMTTRDPILMQARSLRYPYDRLRAQASNLQQHLVASALDAIDTYSKEILMRENSSYGMVRRAYEFANNLPSYMGGAGLAEIVRRYARQGCGVDAEKYSIHPMYTLQDLTPFSHDSIRSAPTTHYGRGHIDSERSGIAEEVYVAMEEADSHWSNSFAGVLLFYGGVPQCKMSFAIGAGRPDALCITEPQGINLGNARKSPAGLRGIEWLHVMADVAEHIARMARFEEIGVQSSRNNLWVKQGHLTIKRASQIYDDTASYMGMGDPAGDGNYYRGVRPHASSHGAHP